MTRTVQIPELCLVVLVGVSGSGKSTFARRHFGPTEIVSSDACRGLVSDDENDQGATEGAFAVVHAIAEERLRYGRLAVVDATNVQPDARRPLVELARRNHVLPIAIVLDVPERVCHDRNATRADRNFGPHVVRNQHRALRRSMPTRRDGFHSVIVLDGKDIEDAVFERQPLWTDKRHVKGPFDIIGDVHGCYDELVALLTRLGWDVGSGSARHDEGRTAVFLGDLVDRGPGIAQVLELVMNMVGDGTALCVPGNHENKLGRALQGRDVKRTHGLAESLAQLEVVPAEFRGRVGTFIDSLVSHYVLDEGRLVVAHAGLPHAMQGRSSGAVRSFSLYGDTTGETDEYGLPVRYPWAEQYRGTAAVVYGHTPVLTPEWVNNTICVDTGCVFGGELTALRWPERALVAVPAARVYYEPSRPLTSAVAHAASEPRGSLDLDLSDVSGTRRLQTSLAGTVTIREDQSAAALEVMSRFAVDPRWLIHLPPTMAPPATSSLDGFLEHPSEAFAQYRELGVNTVVCEEKHMGSRALVLVCRDEQVAKRRFKVVSGDGVILTRTGRSFFQDDEWTGALLGRVRASIAAAGLWDELSTDWLLLDTELLPWSVKAEELLRRQYASVGAAALSMAAGAQRIAEQVAARLGDDAAGMLRQEAEGRHLDVTRFVDAYRRYCWPVDSVDGIRIAPFQILASEQEVLARRDHRWHLAHIDRLCATDEGLWRVTKRVEVDLSGGAAVDAGGGGRGSAHTEREATDWWLALTAAGGEGMVVKPLESITVGAKGLLLPGVKVRGREYLRIIYGPQYTSPRNLDRLRQRGLGHKRSLALRETALGIEALDRFVAGEPLHRVHECVFGVLALETEPVDPRL